MTHADLECSIREGMLPSVLMGADFRLYRGPEALAQDWDGWLRMWWSVTYVRMQGFEREEESIFEDLIP